jgi:ABC-type sugar transport system substrate-binding protein
MRKTLGKIAALSVCLGLLLMAVPNANAVQKKAPKLNFLKKPAMLISSIIPFFTSIFDSGKKAPEQTTTAKKVKTAGDLNPRRIADGD